MNINKFYGKDPYSELGYNLFAITSNSSWTITKTDTGDGTSWLSLSTTSGTGNHIISGSLDANTTSSTREMTLTITYCGGLTKTFIVSQYARKTGKGGVIIFTNVNEDESMVKL